MIRIHQNFFRTVEPETARQHANAIQQRRRLIFAAHSFSSFIVISTILLILWPRRDGYTTRDNTIHFEHFLNRQIKTFSNIVDIVEKFDGNLSNDGFEYLNTSVSDGSVEIISIRGLKLSRFNFSTETNFECASYAFSEILMKGRYAEIGYPYMAGDFTLTLKNGITDFYRNPNDRNSRNTLSIREWSGHEFLHIAVVELIDFARAIKELKFVFRYRDHTTHLGLVERLHTELTAPPYVHVPGDLQPNGRPRTAEWHVVCERPNGTIKRSGEIHLGNESNGRTDEYAKYMMDLNVTAGDTLLANFNLTIHELHFTGHVFTKDVSGRSDSAVDLLMTFQRVYIACLHHNDTTPTCGDQVNVVVLVASPLPKGLSANVVKFWEAESKSCAEEMLKTLWDSYKNKKM